jgi:hypothetical protein
MTTASWKVLASHNAFDHRWYVVRRDTLQLPDGTIVDDYFVSVRPDVVVVQNDRPLGPVIVRFPVFVLGQGRRGREGEQQGERGAECAGTRHEEPSFDDTAGAPCPSQYL